MANAIEKLFEGVLPGLRQQPLVPWPDVDELDEEHNPFDDDRANQNDMLVPMENEERVLKVEGLIGVEGWLDDDDRDLIEGGIRGRGMDVLAFYKSRRFLNRAPFPGKWGIFYLRPALIYLSNQIAVAYPGIRQSGELALNLLRQHEHFHFRADIKTLLFESTLGHHLYLPLRTLMRGRSVQFVEEALANRQIMDWASRPAVGIREFAYDFMKLQPGAYARFDERRADLTAEWAGTVVDLKPPGTKFRHDLAAWVDVTPKDFMRSSLCPEYVIRPASLSSWISPVFITPPVNIIVDGQDVQKAISGRYAQLREPWEETKHKLKANRHLRGLDFKPWRQEGRGAYSVRVDDKFRAHLRHESNGQWTAYAIGGHKEMGHG